MHYNIELHFSRVRFLATNPVDGMSTANPNRRLKYSNRANHRSTPPKRVFLLHNYPFRHTTYITTSFVRMSDDECSPYTTRG